MLEITHISRIKWACRRGMLELDILLQPFVEQRYEKLSEADKQLFVRLLSYEDPELFSWFMGHKLCEDPKLSAMIDCIRGRSLP